VRRNHQYQQQLPTLETCRASRSRTESCRIEISTARGSATAGGSSATQESGSGSGCTPQVIYEAGQLTIVAENSKLSDVMSALRACTGADVVSLLVRPVSVSGLGLGRDPARQILATLLGGTKLDYVIRRRRASRRNQECMAYSPDGRPRVASARPISPPAGRYRHAI